MRIKLYPLGAVLILFMLIAGPPKDSDFHKALVPAFFLTAAFFVRIEWGARP